MSGVQIPIPPQTFFLPSRRHDNIFPVQYANGPTKYPRTRVEALIRFESGFARHLSNMFFQILRVINLEMNGQIRNYRLKLVVVVQWTRNSLTVVYVRNEPSELIFYCCWHFRKIYEISPRWESNRRTNASSFRG